MELSLEFIFKGVKYALFMQLFPQGDWKECNVTMEALPVLDITGSLPWLTLLLRCPVLVQ